MTEVEAMEVVELLADTLPDEDDISRWSGEKGGPGWEWHCGSYDKDRNYGCPHSSFWKTVVTSPQWKGWEHDLCVSMRKADELGWDSPEAKQYKERMFDVDECAACGWMSDRHFQEFLKFCSFRYDWDPKKGE
jgi:hypothetical protein